MHFAAPTVTKILSLDTEPRAVPEHCGELEKQTHSMYVTVLTRFIEQKREIEIPGISVNDHRE